MDTVDMFTDVAYSSSETVVLWYSSSETLSASTLDLSVPSHISYYHLNHVHQLLEISLSEPALYFQL